MNWITVFRFFSSLPWSPAAGRCQTQEGTDYTDRDQQFQRMNEQVSQHLKTKEPVISVDLKKNVAIDVHQYTINQLKRGCGPGAGFVGGADPPPCLAPGFCDRPAGWL